MTFPINYSDRQITFMVNFTQKQRKQQKNLCHFRCFSVLKDLREIPLFLYTQDNSECHAQRSREQNLQSAW